MRLGNTEITKAYLGSTEISKFYVGSNEISFIGVAAPTVTSPTAAATDIGETPTITSSAFAVTNGSDTHTSSDWQIASDSGFSTIVVQSLDDVSNLESWTVPAGNLFTSTTYYVRVRHTGTSYGDSGWSSSISFTTAENFFSADAQAVINAMTSTPDAIRQEHINNLISGLETDGIWSKLDALWVMAAADSQAANLDWKNPAGTALTAVNSPVFTVDTGYAGNGSTSYIDTGQSVTGQSNFSQNSASLFVWVNSEPSAEGTYIGARSLSSGEAAYIGNQNGVVETDLNGASEFESQTSFVALYAGNLPNASTMEIYKDGSFLSSRSQSSGPPTTNNLYLLARNRDGTLENQSDAQISVAGFGSALTSTEHANLYSRLNTYLAAIGAI